MILLIDNYDSFTYNLVHYLGELGADVSVHRNDKISADDAIALKPQAIVISPGPCDPDRAGICLELIEKVRGKIPLLGVCLGHQSIGQSYGGDVIRAPQLMHGKMSDIEHTGLGVFKDIPSPFSATRYHSLTLDPETLPASLSVTAKTKDGVIMGVMNEKDNIHGVQFHPESIASEHGHKLLANFMALAGMTPSGDKA